MGGEGGSVIVTDGGMLVVGMMVVVVENWKWSLCWWWKWRVVGSG